MAAGDGARPQRSEEPKNTRTKLPDRRRLLGFVIEWPQGSKRTWSIQVGFDAACFVREIFGDGPKSGTDMHAVLDDGCILASIALQFGATIQDLAHAVSREASRPDAPAASIVGVAIEAAARQERWVREGSDDGRAADGRPGGEGRPSSAGNPIGPAPGDRT